MSGNSTADRRPKPAATQRLAALVERASAADSDACHELHRLAYPSVIRYAAELLRSQSVGHTLDAAALAHEGYVRLAAAREFRWNDYGHFLAAWFQAMRHHLVDHADAKAARKRGGGWRRGRLTGVFVAVEDRRADLLAVHDALEALSERDPDVYTVIELKFFGGFEMREIAEATGRSLRSVERDWRFGRTWLLAELSS